MYKDILYPEQIQNLEILSLFSKDFYLAGGTAIALQIGHRKSIDFDLFSQKVIENSKIIRQLKKAGYIPSRILIDNKGEELTLIISGTKVTFLHYPFNISLDTQSTFSHIQLPNLLTLGAMKFYTLGRRGKWKDYVDIYHLCKTGLSLNEISALTEEIFAGGYNEKLLREQLCYFEDVDFSEEVEYMGKSIPQKQIQEYLERIAIS